MENLSSYKDDVIMLLESGFIAVNQFDEDSALKLFKAADLLDHENYLINIGYGYLHLHKLELAKAIASFEQVIKEHPDNEMARAFLGISLSMTPNGVNKGEQLLEKTVKSKDPFIKKLSLTAIDFIEKFVKKGQSPMDIKAKKKSKK